MKKVFVFLSLLCLFEAAWAQDEKFTLSGHIRDAASGEALIGASVFAQGTDAGAITNLYGFYSLTLPAGVYKFEFSYLGYDTRVINVELNSNMREDVEISETSTSLSEVVVKAEKEDRNVESVSMSREKMSIEKIKTIPVVLGEVDIIKALQLLPGVQTVGEGQGGFYVRGGGGDQNLLLLDEAPVYNSSHLLGFFSVFNADAIKDVQLYKGGTPASYGGRLSSVLDIRMKDGNKKKFSGSGGIGTIASRLTLEAPINNGRGSFIVSGRRTYADVFLVFASDTAIQDNKLFFYDLNLKANYQLGEKDRLFISGYFGKDVLEDSGARINWGNGTGTVRWNHIFNDRLFSNFTLIYSDYNYFLGDEAEVEGFKWDSNIEDVSAKLDFNYYLNPKNSLKFGYQGIRHKINPGFARGSGDQSIFNSLNLPTQTSLEHALYLENEHQISSRLSASYGLRASLFQNIGEATTYSYDENFELADSTFHGNGSYKNYFNLEPRVGVRFKLDDKKSIKASYQRMAQYLHLASNGLASSPLDIWFSSSPNVKPQLADQVALGYFQNIQNNMFETSVEVYYKKMQNSIDFKDHAELLLNRFLEGDLRFGESRSYGAEFLIKKTKGDLTGWLGYTWSKAERQIPEINNGQWYPTNWDKRHDITLVLNYQLTKRIGLSANWVYGTGAPTTYPTGRFTFNGEVIPVYSDRNAARMPDYHRMDVSLILKNKEKPGRKWESDWNFSIYNLYNRQNPYTISVKERENSPGETFAEMTYLFPVLPSVTWNFKF